MGTRTPGPAKATLRPFRGPLLAAALVGLVNALAGCGSDDPAATSAPAPAPDAGPPEAGAPAETEPVPTRPPGAGATFGFEARTDPTSAALVQMTGFLRRAPETDADAQALAAQRAAGLGYCTSHRDACVEVILGEFGSDASFGGDRALLALMLLRDLRGPAAARFMKETALRPRPPLGPVDPSDRHDLARETHSAVTSASILTLGALMKLGDRDARAELLALIDATSAGSVDVRAAAVAAFLRASPQRFVARRELKKHLTPSDYPLLETAY